MCTKRDICNSALPHTDYRAVYDEETFDNWVDKFELLCLEGYKIGLLGSLFFVGIATSTLFIPALADKYGRKGVTVVSWIIALVG